MRHLALFAAVGLSCAGCGMIGPPPAELAYVNVHADPANPACKAWTAKAQIDLRQEDLVGQACPAAGGGWQVSEGTAANPHRFDALVDAATAGKYPWNGGPPVGISTGRQVVYFNWDQEQSGEIWRIR